METGRLYWKRLPSRHALCPMCGCSGVVDAAVSILNPLSGKPLDFWRCSHCEGVFPDPFTYPSYESSSTSSSEIGNFGKFYVEVGAGIDAIVNTVAALSSDKSIKSFLDVGCGFGYSVHFAKNVLGWDAVGVEPGQYGRAGAAALGINIDPHLLGGGSVADGRQFDFVFSTEVLEHVDRPKEYLRLLFDHTSAKGKVLITTPAAEYVHAGNWVDKIIATLSPGYHAFLYSERGLDAAMREAGFADVRVIRRQDRLVGIAAKSGRLPNIDPFHHHHEKLRTYYRLLMERSTDDSVRCGAGFRLFKEYVNLGWVDQAEAVLGEVQALVDARYIPNFFSSQNIAKITSEVSRELDAYGRLSPYFLSPLLYYWGMMLLVQGRPELAAERFEQAELLALVDIDCEQAWFVEAAGLLWMMKLHRGISLLRAGRRDEAIGQFLPIVLFHLAPEYPWTRAGLSEFIVSRAFKEMGVALLQLGRFVEARTIFAAALMRPEEPENRGLHEELRRLADAASCQKG